jgi:hypothetical protein
VVKLDGLAHETEGEELRAKVLQENGLGGEERRPPGEWEGAELTISETKR